MALRAPADSSHRTELRAIDKRERAPSRKLMPSVAADSAAPVDRVEQLCCMDTCRPAALQDRLHVISKSAALIMAPRHHDGVSRYSLTDRLCAQLGKVEQDRDQDDREHIAACKGD